MASRKAVARKSLLLAFAIIAVFTLTGHLIFEMFGITLYAFRLTGDILPFCVGYNMLHGEQSKVHSIPARPFDLGGSGPALC